MLNLKKVIALVCTLALVITSVSVVSFASTYTDVTETSAYYEAVESLSKLDIITGYEDGTFKPDETVTRAEMAALIARIKGFAETASGNAATVFTDVAANHWASGYIAQANGFGIINGYGDGTFGPEAPVKYEEAVKMIMATLGYTPYATNNGGYPTGYLAAAQFYGVTKGVSNATVGSGANRGTIAQLLANAIDTPLMEQAKWSTDGTVEYKIYDGKDEVYKTLMSEYLDVVKLKGVVMETSVLSLKGDKDIDTNDDKAVIVDITDTYDTNNKDFPTDSDGYYTGDIDEFLIGDTDIEDYLGMSVIMFVRENDDNDYEVISVAADNARNKTVSFTLDQFDTVDGKYIKYFKNSTDSTSTKVQLSEAGSNTNDAIITLNGKIMTDADTAFDTQYGIEENGKTTKGGLVTLIDNDGKTGYDVVMIEIAATAVVDEVSDEVVSFKEQAVLHDGTMSQLDVEEDDTDTVIEIVKDGALIDYTDLAEWDVLSIIAPNDDNTGYIRVEVISNPVTGTITADKTSKTSATGKAYKVDGKYYDVAEGGYKTKGLSVNDAGIFYIDKYGKIAAFNEDSSVATGVAGTYGYVYNTLVTDKNMDAEVQVKMVTANGVELMNFASSVSVNYKNNGKTTFKVQNITDSEIAAEDATLYGSTKVSDMKGQVVKFTKNSNGDIKTITFADYNDNFESVKVTAGKYQYDADTFKLGKFIDEDATIFFIGTAADKCSVGTPADLSDNNNYEVLAMYADSKADDNNIVVIRGTNSTASASTSLAVLTDVSSAKDENDDDILVLSYVVEGTAVEEVETIEDVTVVGADDIAMSTDDLTVGDLVRIKTNSAGKVSGVTVLWNFKEDVRVDNNTNFVANTFTSADSDELLYGGAVTAAYDADKVYFKTDLDWDKVDGEGNTVALTDQVSDWVNIGKAQNVYTIQTVRDGNVSVKKGGSFNYIKQMFDNTGDYNFYYNGDDTGVEVSDSTIADYVDYVFVREYDGRIEDVVIVKAPKKVAVKAN